MMEIRLETPNLDHGRLPEWLEPDFAAALLQKPNEDTVGAFIAAARILRARARLEVQNALHTWIVQSVDPSTAALLTSAGLENAETVLSNLRQFVESMSSLGVDAIAPFASNAALVRAERDDAESLLWALGIAAIGRTDGDEIAVWETRLSTTLAGCDAVGQMFAPILSYAFPENRAWLKAMQPTGLWWLE